MKPLHIILIIIAGLGVAAVTTLFGNTTKYVSFVEADQLAKENPGRDYHVVCSLDKSKPIEYNAEKDANKLVFYAVDSLGNPKQVIYNKPKPQDMERSEKVMLVGHSEGAFFKATEISMKCPSKYEDAPVKQ
ncbi:MAG: cytochrome c maturation protein CcmE [Bacteroidia bacterium]|jgi:cytochrome c-type biogenesis protein CcmE|nr:cytochrome c maturation protein CcmE [Bacteroidia bacterium]